MIIRLHTANRSQIQPLLDYVQQHSPYCKWNEVTRTLVAPKLSMDEGLAAFTELGEFIEIDTPYQLASIKAKAETVITIKGESIGGNNFTLMAGPCSVENEEQVFATAALLQQLGIKFIRGGAYKPRTSPYAFMGLGKKGLQILSAAAKAYDLRVVTEIMDLSLLDEVAEHADILQVGSRNMHNFYMLGELGKINKPVLLKRGMQAKVTEWLLAAEYILSGGNANVILCERGIRSFDPETRNVLDIGVIPLIKELSHLPIIADPSHGTGKASRVESLSLAATAAGAHGLLIETHPNPAQALSDSQQALSFESLSALVHQLKASIPTPMSV